MKGSVQFTTWICLLIVALNKEQSLSVPSSSAHALSQMKGSSSGTFTLLTYVCLGSLILKDLKALNKISRVFFHTQSCCRKYTVCVASAHSIHNIRFRKVILCLRSFTISSPGEIQTQVTHDFKSPKVIIIPWVV